MPHTATTDFVPLDLSVDDLLPADIELVMGYRGGIEAEVCAAVLLEKFAASLDQRIAWPDGSVLEWGAFVSTAVHPPEPGSNDGKP